MRLPGPNLNLDRTSVRFNRFRFRTSVQNRTSASLAYTNHSTLRYSKTIQMLNGKRTRQNLFLSNQPDRYTGENTDNQDGLLSPNGMLVRTIDEKLYKLIEENGNVQNIFYAPMEGILLPWNPLTPRRRGNNLLFYVMTFDLGIHPGPLSMDLLQFLKTRMVMEDHGSTAGVISRILKIPEPYNDGITTISLDTLRKRYELSDKSISDPRTHSVLHKSELLLGFKWTTNTAHNPWKNGTTERIKSEIWKLFFPTLIHNKKSCSTRESIQQKLKKRILKQEGLLKKSKKPSIFRNYHPELSNHWRNYLTSILSTYKKHDVLHNSQHMKDDINDSRKSSSTI